MMLRGLDTQRGPQGFRLAAGQAIDERQNRPHQLMQPGKREIHFGLDAGDAHHPHVAGLLQREFKQGGLADAGRTGDHQGSAATRPSAPQYLSDPGALDGSSYHQPILLTVDTLGSVALDVKPGPARIYLPPGVRAAGQHTRLR
jgi:hypothetical protein